MSTIMLTLVKFYGDYCAMLLDEQSSYMKSVIDTIMDGLMVIDTNRTIVSVNRAMESLTGYSKRELIGKDCSILACDKCFRFSSGKNLIKCILFEKGIALKLRCTLKRKDGSPLVVLKNANILRDTNGQVIGGVETLTDLSEIVVKDRKIAHFNKIFTKRDGFAGNKGVNHSPCKKSLILY